MPAAAIPAAVEVGQRLSDALKDWERIKCRLGGRRLRTACKTVSPQDVAPFRSGALVPYLAWLIADDFKAAWDLPPATSLAELESKYGITYTDLADVHLTAFVPTCLNLEAGRHTCHPEEEPGVLFNWSAHHALRDQIRSGKFKWRGPARGGDGGETVPPGPGGGIEPKPGQKPPEGGSGAALGLLALVGVALMAGRS